MPWESEEEPAQAGRDWAKLMWLGVAAVIAVGLVLLFIPRDTVTSETRARVKQILIRYGGQNPEDFQAAYDTAESLRERILAGESFSKLAEEYSADEHSAPRGGDVGWVHREELPEQIDEYIWTAPLNEISPLIPTPYGVHIVMVVDRQIAAAEEYERELKERVLEEPGTGAAP